MQRLYAGAILFLAVAGVACAGKSAILTPMGIVEAESGHLSQGATKIALARTVVGWDLAESDAVKAEFDSIVEATLRGAGFVVVPASDLESVYASVSRQASDSVNARPNTPDSVKAEIFRRHLVEHLSDKFDVDAVLFPTIEVITVQFTKGTVKWLGASECVLMRWYMPGCGPYKGAVEAATFFATVVDSDNAVVFRNGGGIQLLRKIGTSVREGFEATGEGTAGTWVPREKLFVDAQRNTEAVKTALGPLVEPRALEMRSQSGLAIDVSLPVFVFLVLLAIAGGVVRLKRNPKPVFDRDRRELRYGRNTRILFSDLEVRVFRYRQEEDPETRNGIQGSFWGGMAAGIEEIHRVYVRSGSQRVDLSEFGSAEEAESYADEIRAMIADG